MRRLQCIWQKHCLKCGKAIKTLNLCYKENNISTECSIARCQIHVMEIPLQIYHEKSKYVISVNNTKNAVQEKDDPSNHNMTMCLDVVIILLSIHIYYFKYFNRSIIFAYLP